MKEICLEVYYLMNKVVKKLVSVISVVMILCLALSGCATIGGSADGAASGAATTGGTIQFVISIVLLIVIFYFFMIRPEKKRRKKEQELRSSLGVGDEIVTIGGMMGKIVEVTDEKVIFETGEDRVRIQVAKWAISRKEK